jgi:hypothetical protein
VRKREARTAVETALNFMVPIWSTCNDEQVEEQILDKLGCRKDSGMLMMEIQHW